MIEKIRKFKAVIMGKDFLYKPTIKIKSEKLGNKSEGWWIASDYMRLGGVVFSFGLGEDISFDLAIMSKYNSKVYGFDPTPKALRYVKSLNIEENFILKEYAVADKNGHLMFNLPENENHVSGSFADINSTNTITVEAKRLITILEELKLTSSDIDILKMDIEGAEYDVIEDMIASKIFPKQVLIEYHHFFDSIINQKTKDNIRLLLDSRYELFYIEGYNYSFIRKDLLND